MILRIEPPLELPSTLRSPNVIRLRCAANATRRVARVSAREVLQRHYVQWFAGETQFTGGIETRAKRTHKQVPFAVTPQHRALHQHEPQNRSRSLRALRTPVVTASRQARDNKIPYIFSTSTCKDTERQRQQHTPRDRSTHTSEIIIKKIHLY